LGLGQIGGCASVVPTIPLPINLGSNADFDVQSGVPTSKTFATNFTNNSGISLGSGSIQIDPSSIAVTPDQGKVLQTIPIPDTCGDACVGANVSAEICTSVCNAGTVNIRVWVGLSNETDPMATGDAYGPFVVTLDGEANPISIDPETADLQDKTKQAINEGQARVTVQVISPYTGVVTLDAITVNAGL